MRHRHVKPDLTRYPNVVAYFARLEARPSVVAAYAAEGLEPLSETVRAA